MDPVGTQLGPSWDPVGTQLGPSWDPVGTQLGPSMTQLISPVVLQSGPQMIDM